MKQVRLNRCLTLEAAERVPDGAGGYAETWTPLGTLWAEVTPRSGRLTRGDTDALSLSAFRITVRASEVGRLSRPVPGQRFSMNTRRFRIEAVTEQEPRGLYLICQCKEELAT